MKKYIYSEPDNEGKPKLIIQTEEEILRDYFPYWSEQMRKVGKEHLISKEACIEDWMIVNWAAPFWEEK